jgi:Cdc6-like AAA superfamily ATPase
LQTDKVKKKQVPFTFISVNGMCLAEPAQVFVEIYCAMNGKKTRITPIKARKYLDLAFAELDRSPIVLLIDEVCSVIFICNNSACFSA